jgi:hypothetical protein
LVGIFLTGNPRDKLETLSLRLYKPTLSFLGYPELNQTLNKRHGVFTDFYSEWGNSKLYKQPSDFYFLMAVIPTLVQLIVDEGRRINCF